MGSVQGYVEGLHFGRNILKINDDDLHSLLFNNFISELFSLIYGALPLCILVIMLMFNIFFIFFRPLLQMQSSRTLRTRLPRGAGTVLQL